MNDSPHQRPARKGPARLHRLVRWARQRRRVAIGLLLRGTCYGLGTGLAGIATFWVQHHM
jgi:hypothetical protein